MYTDGQLRARFLFIANQVPSTVGARGLSDLRPAHVAAKTAKRFGCCAPNAEMSAGTPAGKSRWHMSQLSILLSGSAWTCKTDCPCNLYTDEVCGRGAVLIYAHRHASVDAGGRVRDFTHETTWYEWYFKSGVCNVYTVDWGAMGFTLAPF